MANSFWRWIAVLGLVLASADSAQARHDDREKLEAKLAELAAPLQVEGLIFIEAYAARGGRIEWSVWYDRAKIGPYLDQAGINVANTEKAQLVSWYRDLNAKLLAAAQSAATTVLGKDAIDPETDVETEFTSAASPCLLELLTLLNDDDPMVRYAAVMAARHVCAGSPDASSSPVPAPENAARIEAAILERLRSMASDPDEAVRAEAVHAARGIKPQSRM